MPENLQSGQDYDVPSVNASFLLFSTTHPAPPHVIDTRMTRTESSDWKADRASFLWVRDVFLSILVWGIDSLVIQHQLNKVKSVCPI